MANLCKNSKKICENLQINNKLCATAKQYNNEIWGISVSVELFGMEFIGNSMKLLNKKFNLWNDCYQFILCVYVCICLWLSDVCYNDSWVRNKINYS